MVKHAALLDGIADTLEALSTTAYQYAVTDRWTRARAADPEHQSARHLEFWIALGDAETDGQKGLTWHDAEVIITCRHAQGDVYSEAKARDACVACMLALLTWHAPLVPNARAYPRSYSLDLTTGEWTTARVRFSLTVADWRA